MVNDIVNFNWDHQIVEEHAFVNEEYAELFGPDAPFPENFPSEASLYHGLFRDPPEGTVKVSWIVTLRNYVGCLDWFIPLLLDLGPPNEVRIIYSFDS